MGNRKFPALDKVGQRVSPATQKAEIGNRKAEINFGTRRAVTKGGRIRADWGWLFTLAYARQAKRRHAAAVIIFTNMPAAKRFDVLGLGGVAVDDVIYVTAYPPPNSKARVVGRERRCGGLTAIALIAAARLGGRCAYAGVLGYDELSQFTLQSLKAEKIDVSVTKQTLRARPIHSNIVVDQQRGTRNIFFDVAGVVGARTEIPAELISKARVLFIDNLGVNGSIRAARLARRAGVPVVADFESDDHPRFPLLMTMADHLIVSVDFATKLTGEKSAERAVRVLAAAGHEVVIVTCGAEGCWYLARGTASPKQMGAFRVRALDTTGCGDVFHGAYAFGLARNLPLEERIRVASAAAALKASRSEGVEGIPSGAEVRRFLNKR